MLDQFQVDLTSPAKSREIDSPGNLTVGENAIKGGSKPSRVDRARQVFCNLTVDERCGLKGPLRAPGDSSRPPRD